MTFGLLEVKLRTDSSSYLQYIQKNSGPNSSLMSF